ncbi:MAG TPA: hypothetical protein VF046_11505 [Gemmatimonadales bacterium]
MHSLSTLLHVALYWLSPRGHEVIAYLLRHRGYFDSAPSVALALGFDDRHQLARRLKHESLPCLEELAAWVRTLLWLRDWEESRVALSRSVLTDARDPAPCYRTVERITGLSWGELRSYGSEFVLLALIDRCRELKQTTPSAGSRGLIRQGVS